MHPSLNNVRREYREVLTQRRTQLERELDDIFASSETVILEIGCGHGHFLTAYADANPGKTCVGIDLVSERIERARRKRDRAKLEKLHFLRAEARLFLDTLPERGCLSSVFILFPDPWPKSRHHKHRVLQPEFLAALAHKSTPTCRLYFRTDHLPYFIAARSIITESPEWHLTDAPWPFEFETVFQRRAARHDSLIASLKLPGS